MTAKSSFRALAAAVAASLSCALPASAEEADSYAAAVAQEPGRALGLFHRYEFAEIRDTPPPEGYAPFYVAHYGRHGSRYQLDKKAFAAIDALKAGKEAGVLSPAGEALLARLLPAALEHEGMWGMLSRLGAKEHETLARRLAGRFGEVFAGGGLVRCVSSTRPRCLASMANFSCALGREFPALEFSFETGERCMRTILHPYLPGEGRGPWLAAFDEKVVRDNVEPSRIFLALFRDVPAARRVVPDLHRFAFDLFVAASAFESLSEELGGADVRDVFAPEEWIALGRARSCIHYAHMANCAEYGHCAAWSARDLALDIASKAREAIAGGGICADLRFGHDSGLRPLAGLVGIEGAGDCSPAAESWKVCPSWKGMPMASNLQIVLYRKTGAEPLAKILYNEEEKTLRGISPVFGGVFYRWSDVEKRLETPGGEPCGRGALILRGSAGGALPASSCAALFGKYGVLPAPGPAFDDVSPLSSTRGFSSAEDVLAAVRTASEENRAARLRLDDLPSLCGGGPEDALRFLEKILLEARVRGVAMALAEEGEAARDAALADKHDETGL